MVSGEGSSDSILKVDGKMPENSPSNLYNFRKMIPSFDVWDLDEPSSISFYFKPTPVLGYLIRHSSKVPPSIMKQRQAS